MSFLTIRDRLSSCWRRILLANESLHRRQSPIAISSTEPIRLYTALENPPRKHSQSSDASLNWRFRRIQWADQNLLRIPRKSKLPALIEVYQFQPCPALARIPEPVLHLVCSRLRKFQMQFAYTSLHFVMLDQPIKHATISQTIISNTLESSRWL